MTGYDRLLGKPEMRARARAHGERISAEDGVATSADILERRLHQGSRDVQQVREVACIPKWIRNQEQAPA